MKASCLMFLVLCGGLARATAAVVPSSAWFQLQEAAGGESRPVQAPGALQAPAQDGLKFQKTAPKVTRSMRVFEKAIRAVVRVEPVSDFGALGTGAGAIIDASGLVLTAYHVIASEPIEIEGMPFRLRPKTVLYVSLFDRSPDDGRVIIVNRLRATIVGVDAERDLALIKIDAGGPLPFLELQTEAAIGQTVWAIGSPFGQDASLSKGQISGLGRLWPGNILPLLQTTAAVNPGNSGGPLLNGQAQIIGVNNSIVSRVAENNGVGFAIPISKARPFIEQLAATGKTTSGSLGISYSGAYYRTLETGAFGFGVIVTSMTANSTALKAGVQVKDLIVSINGRPLQDLGAVVETIGGATPGQKLKLGIQRQTGIVAIEVEVADSNFYTMAPHALIKDSR